MNDFKDLSETERNGKCKKYLPPKNNQLPYNFCFLLHYQLLVKMACSLSIYCNVAIQFSIFKYSDKMNLPVDDYDVSSVANEASQHQACTLRLFLVMRLLLLLRRHLGAIYFLFSQIHNVYGVTKKYPKTTEK